MAHADYVVNNLYLQCVYWLGALEANIFEYRQLNKWLVYQKPWVGTAPVEVRGIGGCLVPG